jgi:hypothetical protein
MTVPYYNELEASKRKIVGLDVLSSYITNNGKLINCISDHKGNDFYYTIYNDSMIFIGKDKAVHIGDRDEDKTYLNNLIALKKVLHSIKLENIDKYFPVVIDFYNVANEQFYTQPFIDNFKAILLGDIEVRATFINIKKNISNLVVANGIKDIEAFGIKIGEEPSFDIGDENLKILLKDKNDFLVQLVGFDKIETQVRKTITTSSPDFIERFYNYLIMDWNIVKIPKYVVNHNSKKVEELINYELLSRNCKLEEEVELIKKYIPQNERFKYFR